MPQPYGNAHNNSPLDVRVAPHTAIRGAYVAQTTPMQVISTSQLGLHPDEAILAQSMSAERQASFAAGRWALREALRRTLSASAGDAERPILRNDRGAPMLPHGVVGSVSHKRSIAVALVAPHLNNGGEVSTVGIDVEERSDPRVLRRDIAPRILSRRELALLPVDDSHARRDAVLLFFALKEAVYKAIDPYVLRHVRFSEVELTPIEDMLGSSGQASVQLGLPEFARHCPILTAWWWRDETHIFAVATTAESPR